MDNLGQAEQTFKLMECGALDFLTSIEYGILLLGNTKAGMTTAMHYIANQVLVGYKGDYDQVFYKIQNSKYENAEIGLNEKVSQTCIPNLIQIDMGVMAESKANSTKRKSFLIDCPGYLYTFGFNQMITNRFFHYLTFLKVEKIKFVITFSYSDMEKTCPQMLKTFRLFLSVFTKLSEIKEDIIEACSIMVTNVPNNLTKKDVVARFSASHDQICGQLEDIFLELKKKIVEKERVFIFHKAEIDKVCRQNTILDELKKEGEQEGKFWMRKIDQNDEADMTHVQISMLDYIQETPKIVTNFFRQQSGYFDRFLQNIICFNFKNFRQTIYRFFQDTKKGEEAAQFITHIRQISQWIPKWRSTSSKYDKFYKLYGERRIAWRNELFNNQQSELSQNNPPDVPFWLCKLKAFKQIQQLYIKSSLMEGEKRSKALQMRVGLIKEILNIVLRLGRRKKQKSQVQNNLKNQQILNFAYEIYKNINIVTKMYSLFEHIKKSRVKLPCSYDIVLFQYPDELRSVFFSGCRQSVVDILINNLYIMEVDESLSGNAASEAAKFLSSIIEDLAQIQKDQAKQADYYDPWSEGSVVSIQKDLINWQIVRKILNEKKLSFYAISFESQRNLPNPSLSMLKQMEEVRWEIRKNITSKQERIVKNNKIVQLMAQILEKNGYQDFAIQLYDAIFDAMKLFQILDIKKGKFKRERKKPIQMLGAMIQSMEMARKYLMKDIIRFLKDVSLDNEAQLDNFGQYICEEGTQAVIPDETLDAIMKLADEAKMSDSPNKNSLK